ncbi:DUF4432 family protein, partial [Escherichia coli]|uniref:DUF4432 family protein n=1 Tax=Escherichia coli TaxID=562 RepID=UPI0021196CA3
PPPPPPAARPTPSQSPPGRAKRTPALAVRTRARLAFTVVKDRAPDIAWASYKDTALSFITPNGVVAPAFFESQGNGVLRSFYA